VLYHIQCQDKPNSLQVRLNNRDAHLAYIQSLGDRLFAAGPTLNDDDQMTGSILIIDFDNDIEAHAFCDNDPYAVAGLFRAVTISRWRKSLPA
tara:strand:- start:149 stop:427 length:279 start_codon:yes stop_codon:yes gene_type:complete